MHLKRQLVYTTKVHGKDHHAILLTSWSNDLLFPERKMTKAMLDNLFYTVKFKTRLIQKKNVHMLVHTNQSN